MDHREFLRVFYETRFNKLLLLLHSWELLAALLLFAWLSGWNGVLLGFFIGALHHMVLDQIGNGTTPWGYFFVYRAVRRFATLAIVKETVILEQRRRSTGTPGAPTRNHA